MLQSSENITMEDIQSLAAQSHTSQSQTPQQQSSKMADGLLANLQERLVKTDSGFSVITSSISSNTDLRTLADLAATMGDKTETSVAAVNSQESVSEQHPDNADIMSKSTANNHSLDSQENIAKALDRWVLRLLSGFLFLQLPLCAL